MVRDILSKIFSSRVFYVVFSAMVAVALWVFVQINENQETTIRLADVPVIIVGEDVLRDRDLFILPTWGPQTITLEIDCNRTAASQLTNSPVEARIDVSRITTTGGTSVAHEIILPEEIETGSITRIAPSVERITMRIDRLTSKQVRVDVPYTGGAASDFMIDDISFDPQTITIHGPADVLSRIGSSRVEIVRENLSATYIDDLPFVLIDEYGEHLSEELYEQLTFSAETIHVIVPVRMTKEVWLDAEFIYSAGATSSNVSYLIEPEYIILAGEPDVLRDINTILIGQVNLSRSDVLSDTEMFPIFLPNGVENLTGITQASVSFDMTGLEIAIFPVNNFHYINGPEDHTARILTQGLDVRVRGSRAELNRLRDVIDEGFLAIRIVADLSEAGTGQSRLPAGRVTVNIDGFDSELIGAVGSYRVSVEILEDTE